MISIHSISGIVSLTSGFFLILLFLPLYLKKFESKLTLLFMILVFSASICSFGQMMIYNSNSFEAGMLWDRIRHIGLALLVPFWVLFINYYFLNPIKKLYLGIVFIVPLVNIFLILFTNLFLTKQPYLFKGFQKIGKEGSVYIYFLFFYSIIIILEYIKAIKSYVKYKSGIHLPVIIGIGILIITGFKDLLETFFDTGIPMLFETGQAIMNIMFAYSLMMRFIQMYRELEDKKRLAYELEIALTIQSKILPRINEVKFEDIEISALTSPAEEIGGDFYDFFPLDNDIMAFVIGDVSGKGIPAAFYMSIAWATIKIYAVNYKFPAEVVYNTNNFLFDISKEGMFATLVYGIYYKNLNKLTYISAGHTYPIYYNSNLNRTEFLICQNKPVGIFPNIKFNEKEIIFNKGDLFFIYTDGVIEATNNRNEQFGETRLVNIMKENLTLSSNQIISKIFKHINNFYKSSPLFDDITMMAIKKW